MNDNGVQRMTLRQQYGRKTEAWQEKQEPVVRFWTSEGHWLALPFFALGVARYFPDKETALFEWMAGNVVVTGPKALEFFEQFCANRATALKADGKDIVSVEFVTAQVLVEGEQEEAK